MVCPSLFLWVVGLAIVAAHSTKHCKAVCSVGLIFLYFHLVLSDCALASFYWSTGIRSLLTGKCFLLQVSIPMTLISSSIQILVFM